MRLSESLASIRGDDSGDSLALQTRNIAEKTIELHWRQCRPLKSPGFEQITAENAAGDPIGRCLEADGHFFFAFKQIGRDGILDVKELVRFLAVEFLLGDLVAVNKDVEGAAGVAAPITARKRLRPLGKHLQLILKPSLAGRVPPAAL